MNLVTFIGYVSFLLCLLASTHLQTIPDEDWGYVTVRKGAHMFWWLYGMTDKAKRPAAPLVMWLQGGPGASSTGMSSLLLETR
jgi:serine carboxypeptidase 1